MNYLNAARRYWWIVLVGVALSCITGIVLVYKVDRLFPPQLSKRAKPVFSASTELLVDSPSGPFLRTLVPKPSSTGVPKTPVRTTKGGKASTPAPTTTTTPASALPTANTDTKSLVDAANLFPLLVESDAVYAIRRRLVGDIPGAVHAQALYSSQGTSRYRPTVIPVMQIGATAPKAKFAVALADGTARAFRIWLGREQARANIPASERIIVRELHVPRVATASGGSSYGLPGLASFGVLAVFIALAILLDQRRSGAAAPAEVRPIQMVEDATKPVERGVAASGGAPDQPLG